MRNESNTAWRVLSTEDKRDTKTAGYGMALLLFILLVCFNESRADQTVPMIAGIEDTKWQLVELSNESVSPLAGEKRPHILLDSTQKKATGFAGCNNFFGGYEIDEDALTFGPVGSTRMTCPDLQLNLETAFFNALAQTNKWEINNEALFLLDERYVLARFTKEDNAEIADTVWQWEKTNYNDDRKTVPADPQHYTVQFRENGTVDVKADCNQKGGTYSASAEEKRLFIEITHSTMAACPEGSLEDEFVRALSTAAFYYIKDGELYIDLKYDTGTIRLSKQRDK
jgi:heat shock protein HslJ